jgi:predicted metal-dependent peptidase
MAHEGPQPSELARWLHAFTHDRAFLEAYPYYAHVLDQLTPVHDPSVPLMGLSLHPVTGKGARYYLHVNVNEVLKEPQYLRGLLLHEVHHLVLGHLAHPKFFGLAHKDLLQIAQETCANEYIGEPLPSPILQQHFESFGFRAGQSTLDRYELLCTARAEGREPKLARDTRQSDEHAWREQAAPTPSGLEETRQLLSRTRDEAAQAPDKRKEASQRGKLAGRTPDQLLAMLGALTGPPQTFVPWREALRMFAAETRAPAHTWSRPARRFPGRIGEIPGRAYQRRPSLRPTLLIAIDTSLSMDEDDLAEVARQLVPMNEHARLWVVECDTEITRSYPFSGALRDVKGRGGTDLRPVFEPAFLRAHSVDGVVYFTDGKGPTPEHSPHVPVLFVLTRPDVFQCPWGRRVALDLPQRPAHPPKRR